MGLLLFSLSSLYFQHVPIQVMVPAMVPAMVLVQEMGMMISLISMMKGSGLIMQLLLRSVLHLKQKDIIVFNMFEKGHNQCKRKSLGTYSASIPNFVKAYTKQMEDNADIQGQGFDISDDAINLLECYQYAYNSDVIYAKIGCRSNTGKGFQIFSYSDQYCTQSLSSEVRVNVDISTLRVSFDTCNNCVIWPNNMDDDDSAEKKYDDGFYYDHDYDSPLCSAVWYYKSECNGRCKKLAQQSNRREYKHFSFIGKFFLFILSSLGIFLLLAVLAQRKKMSTQDALLEETAVKKVGLEMKYIPRVVLSLIVFISFLMLVRAKALTWFCLILADTSLFAYWSYLKYRAEGHVTIGGVQFYSDDEHSLG